MSFLLVSVVETLRLEDYEEYDYFPLKQTGHSVKRDWVILNNQSMV